MEQLKFWLFWACSIFCVLVCGALSLVRAIHIFQLESYQSLSYRLWLGKNKKEVRSCKRWFPLLFVAAGLCFGTLWPTLPGTALFVLLNRPPKAKRPLVYTARLKRLLLTAALFAVAVLAAAGTLYARAVLWTVAVHRVFFALVLLAVLGPVVLLVLLQYRLVLLYAFINQPIERHITGKYIREARELLAGMPHLRVIGITGSYGKTSVKHFLKELLSVRYEVCMTPGNFNTTLGVVRTVREHLRPTDEIFLCEMGARHPGDIREICELVHPTLGVLTAIGPQHLETFGSQQAIIDGKRELYDAVHAAGGHVFVNEASPLLAAQRFDGGTVSYAGAQSDYALGEVKIDAQGASFELTAPDGERQVFTTRLLGEANIQNLCGAIALAHELGIPLRALATAVCALPPVAHRLELKRQPGMNIIDDAYNSNPEGARVALRTLERCGGTRICVTPGLVELGAEELRYNRELGAYAAGRCDWLLTVGTQARTAEIRAGAAEAGMDAARIMSCTTVQEALARAYALPGEEKMTLLLNDLTDNY